MRWVRSAWWTAGVHVSDALTSVNTRLNHLLERLSSPRCRKSSCSTINLTGVLWQDASPPIGRIVSPLNNPLSDPSNVYESVETILFLYTDPDQFMRMFMRSFFLWAQLQSNPLGGTSFFFLFLFFHVVTPLHTKTPDVSRLHPEIKRVFLPFYLLWRRKSAARVVCRAQQHQTRLAVYCSSSWKTFITHHWSTLHSVQSVVCCSSVIFTATPQSQSRIHSHTHLYSWRQSKFQRCFSLPCRSDISKWKWRRNDRKESKSQH